MSSGGSDRLSDEDLERIEAWAESLSLDEMTPRWVVDGEANVLALVAEVRRLRAGLGWAHNWLVEAHDDFKAAASVAAVLHEGADPPPDPSSWESD